MFLGVRFIFFRLVCRSFCENPQKNVIYVAKKMHIPPIGDVHFCVSDSGCCYLRR